MPVDQIPIGTFSRITHLSQKALRLYDERGLLVPAARDICTGYRYYTFAQVERGIRIRNLLWPGFGLSEVEAVLEARERGDAAMIREHFTRRLAATEREAGRLHAIAEALRKQQQDPFNGVLSMSITEPVIKDIPAVRALNLRERGVYQEAIPRMIGELLGCVCSEEGRKPAAKVTGPIMFICHDEEYREADADIEVAVPITGPVSPSRELYLNDPAEVPEDELLTEVLFPVEEIPPSP